MNRTSAPVLVAACLALAALPANAVPQTLSHQGRIMMLDGSPYEGLHEMAFTIYDLETTGVPLWTETSQNVPFSNGYYAVVLGGSATNPIGPALAGPYLFLEISVDGATPGPRHPIHSVPYALRADGARNIAGGTADVSSVTVGGQLVIDGTGRWVGPTVSPNDTLANLSCAVGDVPVMGAAGWSCTPLPAYSGADFVLSGQGCGPGEYVTGVDADGLVQCNAVGVMANLSCAVGQVPKFDGLSWQCGTDLQNPAVLYSAGSGLSLTGTTFAVATGGIIAQHVAPGAVNATHLTSTTEFLRVTDGTNTISATNATHSMTLATSTTVVPTVTTASRTISMSVRADSLTSAHLGPNSVGSSEIAALAVQTGNLADGSVTTAKIGAGQVQTANLADGNVTSAKIATSAVTGLQIAAGAVGTAAIENGAITSAKLNLPVSTYSASTTSTTQSCTALVDHRFCALSRVLNDSFINSGTNVYCIIQGAPGGFQLCARGNGTTTQACSMMCF